MTEIVIIGSGTCVPSLRRGGPSTCLLTDGITILVDSASGTLRQLVKAGIPYESLDYLLYTHVHPDHVGEFIPYVFATKYAPGFNRTTPVTVLAAKGFKAFYQHLKDAYGHWAEADPGMLNIEEIPVEMQTALQLPPLIVRTTPTRHTPMSLAYRIECPDGKAVVFSGDTEFSPELIELAKDADLMVCECAAPEGHRIPGHLIPSEAGKIAKEAGVKRLILTHFYPNCDQHDLLTPCKKEYSGPVVLAEDLMRIILV